MSNESVNIRYAVDENPPHWLSAALGFQVVVLILAGITLTPIIVLRAAELPGHGDWVVFAALLVSGITTMIQARPIGFIGAGYVLFMGTSGAFIAIGITAIKLGGLPLLATLIVASSLVQFLFSARLGLLRKIVTPTVGGTVIMLIAVTVFPIVFNMLSSVPESVDSSSLAAPVTVTVTFIVTLAVSLFAQGSIRLWGPLIGVIVGCVVSYPYGLIDFTAMMQAPWLGLPDSAWPGLNLTFGSEFWILLPGFIIVTIVGALETYGDGIAIQRVSQRTEKPVDFRAVQGAVAADGLGNLLSGLLGTMPNTTYSTSISVVDMTGVGARRVGLYGGLILVMLAFLPKVSALLQTIPAPVAGTFIMVLLILLFVHGLRLVMEGGLSYENGFVMGLAFWLGVGFQNQLIFSDQIPAWAHTLLDNGMTTGGVVAIVLTGLLSMKSPPSKRMVLPAKVSSLPELHAFIRPLGVRMGWDQASLARLDLIAEEAFLFLLECGQETSKSRGEITIAVHTRTIGECIELEMVSAPRSTNLEGLVKELKANATPSIEEAGLRILKHLAADLKHEQFNEVDFLTLQVDSKPLK